MFTNFKLFLLASTLVLAWTAEEGCPSKTDNCWDISSYLSNGRFLKNESTAEGFIECDKDYQLTGPATVTCRNGTWLPTPGICILSTKVSFERLIAAIQQDDVDGIDDLLEQGKLVNAQNMSGLSALHLSAMFGAVKVARYLINQAAADIHIKTQNWLEPAHLSAQFDKLEIFEMLLEKAGDDVNSILEARNPANYRTPIFYASIKGSEVGKLLMAKEVNGELCDVSGKGPLHIAIENRNLEMTKLLMEKVPGASTLNLLELAAEANFVDFLTESSYANVESSTPAFCKTASSGSVEFLEKLKSLIPDVELQDFNCSYKNGASTGPLLHVAAYNRQVKYVQYLLENGLIDALARDSDGATALHVLAGLTPGNEEEILPLITDLSSSNTEVIDAVDKHNKTPFMYSVMANSLKFADALQNEFAAYPNIIDDQGLSAFHHVRSQRFLSFLFASIPNAFLEINRKSKPCSESENENCLKRGGMTPLLVAIRDRKPIEMIRYMLKFKANPNERNDFGQSSLHLAIEAEYREVVAFLLKKDANPLLQDKTGRTALHLAIEKEDIPSVRVILQASPTSLMVKDNEGLNPCHIAVKRNSTEALRIITNFKLANWTALNSGGDSPLLYALLEGNQYAAFQLISLPGAVNAQMFGDRAGPTALHLAAKNRLFDLTEALLSNNANTSILNLEGLSPIHETLISQDLEMLRILFANGNVDVEAETSLQRNMLHLAVQSGRNSSEIARWLLAELSNRTSLEKLFNAKDAFGDTPLIAAITHENLELVKLFLSNNSSCTIQNHVGLTPSNLAVKLGYVHIFDAMMEFDNCLGIRVCIESGSKEADPLRCGPVPNVANGRIKATENASSCLMKQIEFSCQSGFSLQGSNIIECSDGHWKIDGYCKKDCLSPVVESGSVKVPEQLATITCDPGYYYFGACALNCKHDGSNAPVGSCLRARNSVSDTACSNRLDVIDLSCPETSQKFNGYLKSNERGIHLVSQNDECWLFKIPDNRSIKFYDFSTNFQYYSDSVVLYYAVASASPNWNSSVTIFKQGSGMQYPNYNQLSTYQMFLFRTISKNAGGYYFRFRWEIV